MMTSTNQAPYLSRSFINCLVEAESLVGTFFLAVTLPALDSLISQSLGRPNVRLDPGILTFFQSGGIAGIGVTDGSGDGVGACVCVGLGDGDLVNSATG